MNETLSPPASGTGEGGITGLQFDASSLVAATEKLEADVAGGFAATIRRVAVLAGQSIDQNFLVGGRPDPWKALHPLTIYDRHEKAKTQGISPVAEWDTRLRFTDTLRHAAAADHPGTEGSEISEDGWGWQNELTLPYAQIQNDGGITFIHGDAVAIPARPYFFFQDSDVETFTDIVFADVGHRITAIEAENR